MFILSKLKKRFWLGKLPSFNQWKQLTKVLTKKEKIYFFVFLFLLICLSLFLSINFYFKNTEVVPREGGAYTEGVIGHPRFINPIYAISSDVDRDLTQLIFSSLMKYDNNARIVPDLAKELRVKENGLVYEFYLKENAFWHDGKKLTADDVIFTIKTIQESAYKSPLRTSWLGVEAEKINDFSVRLKLKIPYAAFLENTTLKIIPKHIWQDIAPESFPLAVYNLKPIGSGPYRLKSLKQDKLGNIVSLELIKNPKYHGKPSNISQISFKFFDNEEELIKDALSGKIQGLSISQNQIERFLKQGFKNYELSLPRYFAVFFNPKKSEILAEKEVRDALSYATNKKEIIDTVLSGRGTEVNSPILPENYNLKSPGKIFEFNIEKAKELLEKAGWKDENGDGIREKTFKKSLAFKFISELKQGSNGTEVRELQKCLARFPEIYPEGQINGNFGEKTKAAVITFQEKYSKDILEPTGLKEGTGVVSKTTKNKLNEVCFKSPQEVIALKFSLITVEQPTLEKVANIIKNQWKNLGVDLEVKLVAPSQLEKDIIKPREYDSLLFGEALGSIPDPFPFWHSSQKRDPGLNLSLYESKKADELLEEARKTLDENKMAEKLTAFQDVLINDSPALFLYNPDYIYLASGKIKGINTKIIIDPSKRFADVENWYIRTKRAWK